MCADKISEFFEEKTVRQLSASHGKIIGNTEEFARKTTEKQDAIFAALTAGNVMYAEA